MEYSAVTCAWNVLVILSRRQLLMEVKLRFGDDKDLRRSRLWEVVLSLVFGLRRDKIQYE